MDSLRERLLAHYGVSKEDYAAYTAEPSFSLIPTIEREEAVIEAKRTLDAAILAKQKILIYGDYDTDGIMATSIIKRALLMQKIEASHFIPSRYTDGYGLTMENAKRIAKAEYGLVILVDNGVSCFDSIAYLRQEGINVIVIDHHDLPASLPPANAIVHDKLLKYGEYPISAGFLSYLFSRVMLSRHDSYLFTLGAMSLLSDVMPMLGHNRAALGLALREIRKSAFPEIQMLTTRTYIDEKVLGSDIIPKINAIGRIKTGHEGSRLVDYFAKLEAKDKFPLAQWAKQVNDERKALTSDAIASLAMKEEDPGYCLLGNFLEGVNGLIASRLVNDKRKPIIVFSPSHKEKGMLVGSFRGKDGADFPSLREEIAPYLVAFGGHSFAAGLTIRQKDFLSFQAAFLSWAKSHPVVEKQPETIPLKLSEVHMGTYREIRKFGPFGEKHKEPLFRIEEIPTGMLRYTKNGRFMRTPIDEKTNLLSFDFGEGGVKESEIALEGSFATSEFNGQVTLDFIANLGKKA